MTTAIIVQARIGSTRLPGKTLMKVGENTLLSWCLRRAALILGADVVCCAIPDNIKNDPVATEAERCGAVVVRGSENDLLARYYKAACELKADTIIRITSDCPLTDPHACQSVLDLYRNSKADFACNNAPPSWPHGLDCEITSFKWLEKAYNEAQKDFEREHAMPYIRTHPSIKLVNLEAPTDLTQHRWTLDYPEDFDFFAALLPHLESLDTPTSAILEILQHYPEISAINAMRNDHTRSPAPKS